jgi:hypothetical protein
MSLEQQLIAKVKRYIASQISFEELVVWSDDHEDELVTLGPQAVGAQLASAISLAAWELREGFRPPESVRELVIEEFTKIIGTAAKA